MPIQQTCPYCDNDISTEITDSYLIRSHTGASNAELAHVTCLGKSMALGTYSPDILIAVRGINPEDLNNPQTPMGKLIQLGKDLHTHGALAEPLAPDSPLRNWVLNTNVDMLAGNRAVSQRLLHIMNKHLEQNPRDQEVFQALTERLKFDHISIESIIHPPEGIDATCITITPPGRSVAETAQVHAKAMASAVEKMNKRLKPG